MNSSILQLAAPYIKWIFLSGAVLILFRGHNYPGGGFIGGLLAGLAIVFRGFAYTMQEVKAQLGNRPQQLTGAGLIFVIASFLPSVFTGKSFMSAIWVKLIIPFIGELKLMQMTPARLKMR